MKYTVNKLPLTQPPHEHSSLVSKNTLTVVGGKFKSRGKFSKFTWTELSLKWENGTKCTPSFSSACSVKLGIDLHIIFGGERTVDGQQVSVNQVVKINTTEETAFELSPIAFSRVHHDCQLLNKSMVLVSGGLERKDDNLSEILPDELYDLNTQRVVKVLDSIQSVRRTQHGLVKIENRIWALGGRDSNEATPSNIAEFNPSTSSWRELTQGLHSANTSELIITPIPAASLDCVPQCQCGIPSREERIFGGSEAEVRNCSFFKYEYLFVIHNLMYISFRPIVIPGLVHFCGMRTLKMALSTAIVASYWLVYCILKKHAPVVFFTGPLSCSVLKSEMANKPTRGSQDK